MGSTSAPIVTSPSAGARIDADRAFYRVMLCGYVTLFPMMALFIATALLGDSEAVLVYAVNFGITIAVQGFSIYAMRQVMRRDEFRYPYGAGKLENFAAFSGGVLTVPSGVYLAVTSLERLADPLPVAYGLSLVPVALESLRMLWLYTSVRRLARATPEPPPLLQAYLLDWRANLLSNCGVVVAFAAGLALVSAGLDTAGDRVDPLIALSLSVYMIWIGIVLVRRNFRALMDLPLPEADQLRIARVLARFNGEYVSLGTVYTRSSGKARIVEIELGFDGACSLQQIAALGDEMQAALSTELPDLRFRIVPKVG